MTHALKTWPNFFKAIEDGKKNYELRKNTDRTFKEGDRLLLQEFDPATKSYTGKEIEKRIVHILSGEDVEQFGLKRGYCILSIEDIL